MELLRSDATFSPCRTYRYRLRRLWRRGAGSQLWIMLNPSTADEVANDPTVERCQRRAMAQGWGGLIVCNIFALRSTDPKALYSHTDPVGPENDRYIKREAKIATQVVCAWGGHGRLNDRGQRVLQMLEHDLGIEWHMLDATQSGEPTHPLYVSYARKPVRGRVM